MGKTNLAVYDETTATFYFRPNNGAADVGVHIGQPGDTPLVGDFNNDGKDDFAVFDPDSDEYIVYEYGGSGTTTIAMPALPFTPPVGTTFTYLVGDYQGAGVDLVIFDNNTSTFYVYTINGTLIRVQQLGSGNGESTPV